MNAKSTYDSNVTDYIDTNYRDAPRFLCKKHKNTKYIIARLRASFTRDGHTATIYPGRSLLGLQRPSAVIWAMNARSTHDSNVTDYFLVVAGYIQYLHSKR